MMIAAGVLFLLFLIGIVKAKSRRQVIAVVLAGSVVLMVAAPRPARAQGSLIGAIQAVLNVVNGVIHTALTAEQNVRNTINAFYQQVLWPRNLIQQAHATVTQMVAQYRNQMYSVLRIRLASATLPATQALEGVIRDGQITNFGSLGANYTNVYGAVPGSSSASPYDRQMTDMDDALSQDMFKTLKESDDADALSLSAADQIENAAAQAAPGSAPFLTATAVVGAIQSQAVMQKMIAADLRQDAGFLAHRVALDKEGATSAVKLADALMNLLR